MKRVAFVIFLSLSSLRGEMGESALSSHSLGAIATEESKSHESNKNYKSMSQKQNNKSNIDLALQNYDSSDLASNDLDSSLQATLSAQNDGVGKSRNDKIGESNGIILGLGVNYGSFRFTQNYEQAVTQVKVVSGATGADAREMTTTITQLESPIRTNGNGVGSGLIVGYQGFSRPFSEVVQVGLRVYGDINVALVRFESGGVEYAPTALRYGFNADFMVNFIVVEQIFGLEIFAGVRIGGISYLGDDIKAINRRMQSLGNNAGAFPKSSLDFALNVGLRANVDRNSGFELIFALPVYQTSYKSSNDSVVNDVTTTNRINGSFKEQWSAGVRYIWTFDI